MAGWAKPGVPSAPKAVKPAPGDARAKVTWAAPYSNGGHKVVWYKVTTWHGDVALAVNVFHSTATAQTIVGLKNGEAYSFTVAAKNTVGWSPFSAHSSVVRIGIPGTPAKPGVTTGVGSARVAWVTPANNGSAINWYRVTPYLAGTAHPARVFQSTKTSQLITVLKHGGRYQFKVAAHNKVGGARPRSSRRRSRSSSATPLVPGSSRTAFDGLRRL